ncbi:hypothetical protein [Legionella pneumophila]|uniref:hypothetical protein n=1 Tax=Legionella pneumophila TaxID=446 RepID=UPI001374F2C2|nr:hypothetical protein [Legionella pneumophila]
MKDNINMSHLTAFLFVLSLIYYLGYFYGLGIPPTSIPLTVVDITNGVLSNLPIALSGILVGIILKILFSFSSDLNPDSKNAEEKVQFHTSDFVYSIILFIMFFILLSIIAFKGFNLLISFLAFLSFLSFIKSLPIVPVILKIIINLMVIIYALGFMSGNSKYYSTKNHEQIILTNKQIYKSKILANLATGILVKNNDHIVFINSSMIQSIEYPLSNFDANKK